MSLLEDRNIMVCFFSETWLTEMSNNITALIKSYGYNIIHRPRYNPHTNITRGGGVAIVYHNSLNLTEVFVKQESTFESVLAKFRDNSGENICCASLYRTGVLNDIFFDELDDLVGSIFLKFSKFLICGDVNIHLDNINDRHSMRFADVLSSYGLHQFVTEATHKHGHILDVVISNHKMVKNNSLVVHHDDINLFPTCDHYMLSFTLNNCDSLESLSKKKISFRDINSIDMDSLRMDLSNKLSTLEMKKYDFETIITSFNETCLTIIDSHAPVLNKEICDRPNSPWFDGEYKSLRAQRRKAEKKWSSSGTKEDRDVYLNLRTRCCDLADKKKHEYHKEQFIKHSYSPKSLYKFVDKMLDRENSLPLPPIDDLKDCVDGFNTFFEKKISEIRQSFSQHDDLSNTKINFHGCKLENFRPSSYEEIEEILMETELKTSSLDPIPAHLFQQNQDIFIPILCDIVNASLEYGSIDGLKVAHVTPLLKATGLDTSIMKNYRPISNLTFIGKLIERVVLRRLNEHLNANNLNIPNQSGYKKCHSTETLLLRVVNDLLIASDQQNATIVIMLDLSAAFDTVDHQKLLSILKNELGIDGNAWKWFASFLSGRCQRVRIGDQESFEIIVKFGVPQGSVLGPVLFNLYIRSLYSSVEKLKFLIQGYADDHQVYKSFKPTDQYSMLVDEVPACFIEISRWMDYHYLQLNPGKTEIIVFGNQSVLSKMTIKGTFLNNNICVRFSPVIKSLGFYLDESLSLRSQLNHLKSTCFLKLRSLSRIRKFLNTKQMTMLVQAVILSSLDYCNSLYSGCSQSIMNQLQVIQNRACRLIFGLKKRDDVIDKMMSLHWLKVNERIVFKILLLVYKCVNGTAPSYLIELLSFNNTSSTRMSSLHISLHEPSHPRAFQTLAPKLWHQLPATVKSCSSIELFKTALKTHLFKKSYNV